MFLFRCRYVPTIDADKFYQQWLSPFLAALFRNGQYVSDPTVLIEDGSVVFYCLTPDTDSLDERNDNKIVGDARRQLLTFVSEPPEYALLGSVTEAETPCRCEPTSLILFMHLLRTEPPVVCGNCDGHVGLYRLPTLEDDMGERGSILSWESAYKACDTLYLNSGVGKSFGASQIFGPQSKLTRSGRAICRELSRKMQVPVYYFLHMLEDELPSICPLCRSAVESDGQRLGRFRVICSRCRFVTLVSY